MRVSLMLACLLLWGCEDNTPPPSITSIQGLKAQLAGGIDRKAADQLTQWIHENPNADLVIDLKSTGGSLHHAHAIGHTIEQHGRIQTRVPANTACNSSCAVVWLYGKTRTIEPNAVLLFHGASCATCTRSQIDQENQKVLDLLRRTEPRILHLLVERRAFEHKGQSGVAITLKNNAPVAFDPFRINPYGIRLQEIASK